MPDFDQQGLINIFATEAADGLLKVATALDPRDGSMPTQPSLREHFIVAHGLIGSASLYGFAGCANLAKILVGILEQTGTLPEKEWPKTVALLRDIVTTLRNQIDHINQEGKEDPTIFDDLKARYSQLMEETQAPAPEAAAPEPEHSTASQPDSYFIPPMEAEVLEFFVPEAQEYLEAITDCLLKLEKDPENKDTIHKLFRAAHTLKGSAFTVGFQVVGDMTHYMEDIMSAIRDGKMQASVELTDLFFRAVDEVRLLLGRDPAKLQQIRQEFLPLTQRLHQVATGQAEKTPAAEPEERPQPVSAKELSQETVRVSRDRLERLHNLVGELVIGRSRLEQRLPVLEHLARQVQTPKNRMLEADVSEAMAQLITSIREARQDMDRLRQMTTDLRDEIARTWMVPIGSLFTRFQKAVREMARSVGKDVEVVFTGAAVEVDTGVVQRLVDPLIHMMRNAVAHGIEPPAVRKAAGKLEKGTVSLHAFNRGNTVVIEVEDDGAGLNIEKIKAKAIALGLVRPERAVAMPPAEILTLLYLPGFSMAEEVSDQAGRGVGMDVVRRAITDMNGQIDIETKPGVGTKFTVSLPLTMPISTPLMVRASEERALIREISQLVSTPTATDEGPCRQS